MKKIVVDTNIIFSCLLNTQGKIGDLLFNSDEVFEFYSNDYMRLEIHKHWAKLKKISKLKEDDLETAYEKLLSKLVFINEESIPKEIWEKAEQIVIDFDIDDLDFVALTKYIKGSLWTGDKILHFGLKEKRFRTVYNTDELLKLRNRLVT